MSWILNPGSDLEIVRRDHDFRRVRSRRAFRLQILVDVDSRKQPSSQRQNSNQQQTCAIHAFSWDAPTDRHPWLVNCTSSLTFVNSA